MSVDIEGRTALELDRERVTCLLLINSQLMKKAVNLYTQFLSNQTTLSQLSPQSKASVMDSFQNCTRRIHCNLTVLSFIHEKYHTDAAQQQQSNNRNSFPFIMAPPQDMPELNNLYSKLQELYPEGLQFLKNKLQQMRKQQQQQSSPQITQQNLHQQPPGIAQPSSAMLNQLQQQQQSSQSQSHMQQGSHLMQMPAQRSNSSHLQQNAQIASNSPMIHTPGSNSINSNSMNTPVLKEDSIDFQNMQQHLPINQQNQSNLSQGSTQQFQNGYNPNFNSNMSSVQQQELSGNQNRQDSQGNYQQGQQGQGLQHQQHSSISPQQIFQSTNGNNINNNNNTSNSGSNGMMDYFAEP